MQREASLSRAYLLLDYVQRLERHREGRRAVHIHLSKLKAQNRREHHLRIAENTFDELTKQFDGQVFAMQNGDIVFVCRDASIANMDDAVQRLRRLYEDDPLAQSIDAGHEDLFCTYYNVESQYAPFLEIAEGLYNEEQRRIKRLQMAAAQSGESMQGEQTPLSATTWKVSRISRSGRSFERYAAAIYLRRCRHRPPAPGLQGIVHFNRLTRPTGSA